jgi:thiol-disulfide isomerase/thioredoxin
MIYKTGGNKMNVKKLMILLLIAAVVATGFYYNGLQNTDKEMNEDMIDDRMDEEDMDKNDSDMDDNDNMDSSVEDKMMNEGKMAPDFTLMSVDGMEYTLSEYKDEKVYIKFWASWCSICLSGLEELDELSAMDGFPVLTIVSPGYGSEMNSEDFVEWFAGLDTKNITVLLDEDGVIASQYMVRGYPTSAYIGSDGVLVKTLPGHSSNETIKNSIEGIY